MCTMAGLAEILLPDFGQCEATVACSPPGTRRHSDWRMGSHGPSRCVHACTIAKYVERPHHLLGT